MTLKEYATAPQAAAHLAITEQRIRQLCKAGKFAGAQQLGRDWLIPWAAVKKRKKAPADKGGRPAKA